MDDVSDNANLMLTYVTCPKHGEHSHSIVSTIEGHEGTWCQICWIESLGESLPSIKKPFVIEIEDGTT